MKYMYQVLMILYLRNAGENVFIFHIYHVSQQQLFSKQIFVSCHNLRLVAVLFFLTPEKCENCFELLFCM